MCRQARSRCRPIQGVRGSSPLSSTEKCRSEPVSRVAGGGLCACHWHVVVVAAWRLAAVLVSTTGTASYAYDRLGRLVGATDTLAVSGVCTPHTYGYDTHTNRTSFTTATGAANAPCPTTPTTTITSTYDSADRLVSGFGGSGWTYDPLGRITSMPDGDGTGVVANEFYVNDLIAAQQVPGQARVAWGLEPLQRRSTYEEFAWVNDAWASSVTKVSHYATDSDEPAWILEDSTLPSDVTRFVSGVEGDLAVTTTLAGGRVVQLVDLHGDVVGTLPVADGAAEAPWSGLECFRADEFGNAVDLGSGSALAGRYGWLGAFQRSGEALGGVILMGVRLYQPATGRFMSVDPVAGGSASAYDYCSADPVNCTDLGGTWGFGSILKVVAAVGEIASNIPGPIGAAAAGVSAVAYAAQGNTAQALIMGATAAAALVGAGAVVRVAARAISVARSAGQVARAAPRIARARAALSAVSHRASQVNQTLKQRYAQHLSQAYNGGRARVTIPNRFGRTHYDLHGRAHFSKPDGRYAPTPHVQFQMRNPRSPSGYGPNSPYVRPATWSQLLRVRSHLRSLR